MVVRIDYSAVRKSGRVVKLDSPVKRSSKPVRLPDDAEMMAYFIKTLARNGTFPIEQLDASAYLAACRTLRRR